MKRSVMVVKHSVMAGLIAGVAFAGTAWSHGDTHKGKGEPRAISTEEHAFGREGDPKKAVRTIEVDMADTMRFSPAQITVKQGDTVQFVVKNSGKVMHEFVLGTLKELKEHAELMRKHPGMEHEEAYMAHVAPGKSERLVWQFSRSGQFYYGCLVPGHFEAGMVGKVTVKGTPSAE